jgi:hypothetical protein
MEWLITRTKIGNFSPRRLTGKSLSFTYIRIQDRIHDWNEKKAQKHSGESEGYCADSGKIIQSNPKEDFGGSVPHFEFHDLFSRLPSSCSAETRFMIASFECQIISADFVIWFRGGTIHAAESLELSMIEASASSLNIINSVTFGLSYSRALVIKGNHRICFEFQPNITK